MLEKPFVRAARPAMLEVALMVAVSEAVHVDAHSHLFPLQTYGLDDMVEVPVLPPSRALLRAL